LNLPWPVRTKHGPYYSQNKEDPASFSPYFVFFAAAARAFAAFFLLLLIMTMARNVPTTAEARRVRITGIRIAQTRGGKRLCRGWSSSTNGYKKNEYGVHASLEGGHTMNSVHRV
jgi:hypothetical protein